MKQREIKFRIFVDGEMSSNTGSLAIRPDGKLMVFDYKYQVYKVIGHTIPIMQFTGLLDKNEKEIFEGDIVLMDGQRGVIEWIGSAMVHQSKEDKTKFVVGWSFLNSDCEVLGNIYEHPELIKGGI